MSWTLWTHALSTWALVGLIWTIQLVHYPLFARVGSQAFVAYEREHGRRITWLVGPLMALEALSAAALCLDETVETQLSMTGLALLLVVWLSTAFVQVPCHTRLARGFDALTHRRLVRSNWIRTVAWTLRGALAAWLLTLAVQATG